MKTTIDFGDFDFLKAPEVFENNGNIQVKGVKDGQNGITYGVKFESGAACINLISESEINTYTIIH